MRDYSQELLNAQSREVLSQEISKGKLTPQELITVINSISEFGLEQCLPQIGRALDHIDPTVRISALNALAFAFDSDQWTPRIKEIFASDQDEDVRAAAAVALGSAAKRGTRADILRILKAVFIDTSEPLVVREAARRSFLYGLHKSLADRESITFDEAASLSFDDPVRGM